MTVNTKQETHGFQAEVKQLLHLVVHSLYSNKEIFLRELISNASDALDKLRFSGLSNSKLYEDNSDLNIHVDFNEGARTITIRDNGIGMSREEVVNNLGTIAKSGTREFLANISGDQAKDTSLIGQFGVGFYSAFIIADKVTVKTRRAGENASAGVLWESAGEGEYVIENIEKPSRGTEIILHLKKEEIEFLNDYRLRNIITKYSDHISWPIIMMKLVEPEATADGEEKEKPAEPKFEEETVNKATALWMRSKRDIKDEEYEEFYKHISHDFEKPLLWSHNQVEGKHEYTSLLYIPSHAPFDLWQPESQHGLRLYVNRVFVMDEVDQFLPRYLRFVKGIVDSSDMPLNVSREILQDNKFVESIRGANVKRILSILSKLAKDDKEKYAKFWKQFGLILKEGPIEDFANKEEVAKLLRFSSTQSSGEAQDVSLEDYVSRMHKKQDKIYFIAAESLSAAKNSPHLEAFKERNIEVLLLSDRIDEWLVSHLSDFDGKHLQSVTKGEFELEDIIPKTEEEKKEEKKVEEDFSSLVTHVKEVLGDGVKDVRITHRLTSSPACIVADVHDMGREMQRMLEAAGQDVPKQKPIFEINPKHPIITRLNDETDDERFAEWSHILFDQSILAEGGKLEKPVEFVSRLNKMLLDLSS